MSQNETLTRENLKTPRCERRHWETLTLIATSFRALEKSWRRTSGHPAVDCKLAEGVAARIAPAVPRQALFRPGNNSVRTLY
jgi:hypothetical protein